jgi:hypothetical protein
MFSIPYSKFIDEARSILVRIDTMPVAIMVPWTESPTADMLSQVAQSIGICVGRGVSFTIETSSI